MGPIAWAKDKWQKHPNATGAVLGAGATIAILGTGGAALILGVPIALAGAGISKAIASDPGEDEKPTEQSK